MEDTYLFRAYWTEILEPMLKGVARHSYEAGYDKKASEASKLIGIPQLVPAKLTPENMKERADKIQKEFEASANQFQNLGLMPESFKNK